MSDTPRYRDYDNFAFLYAHHWARDYHEQILAVLERLILHRLQRGARVLDLCCGDGRLARALEERGYRVTGIDGSEAMLQYARRFAAPSLTFEAADAREFSFPESFDAVLSTGDSMNHLLSRAELRKVFANVIASLQPGGWFAFDVNRPEAFRDLWTNPPSIVDIDVVSVARGDFEEARGIASCFMTQFTRKDGQWRRTDYTIREKFYPHEHIVEDLHAAGFPNVQHFDAKDDLGMTGDTGMHRSFYLARKA